MTTLRRSRASTRLAAAVALCLVAALAAHLPAGAQSDYSAADLARARKAIERMAPRDRQAIEEVARKRNKLPEQLYLDQHGGSLGKSSTEVSEPEAKKSN